MVKINFSVPIQLEGLNFGNGAPASDFHRKLAQVISGTSFVLCTDLTRADHWALLASGRSERGNKLLAFAGVKIEALVVLVVDSVVGAAYGVANPPMELHAVHTFGARSGEGPP